MPHRGVSLQRFLPNFIVYGQLHDRWYVKIWQDSLKGFKSYGVSVLGCARYSKCSVPPSGETVHRTRTFFGSARMVRTPSVSPCHVWWARTSHATRGEGGLMEKFDVCLFVCFIFVQLQTLTVFPQWAMEFGTNWNWDNVTLCLLVGFDTYICMCSHYSYLRLEQFARWLWHIYMYVFTLQLPAPRTVIPREKPVSESLSFALCNFCVVFERQFNRIDLLPCDVMVPWYMLWSCVCLSIWLSSVKTAKQRITVYHAVSLSRDSSFLLPKISAKFQRGHLWVASSRCGRLKLMSSSMSL